VTHGQRSRADKAFPTGPQCQAFDRPADRIGAIENPHFLAVLRGRFQHVAQARDESVDAAAQILQVDEDDIEGVHHRVGGFSHLAVQS
jgi:hypothetical protein